MLYYYLELTLGQCCAQLWINDFLLWKLSVTAPMTQQLLLNLYLIGEDNQMVLRLSPGLLESGERGRMEDIQAEFLLKTYEKGEIVSPDAGSCLMQSQFSFDPEKEYPDQVELLTSTFSNQGASFHSRLGLAEQVSETAPLHAYACQLQGLLRERDVEGLYREFQPKLDDFDRALQGRADESRDEFRDFFERCFFPAQPITDFDQEEISLLPFCSGRLWKLELPNHQEFFTTKKAPDGSTYSIPIYIGKVQGELKVVR